MVAKERGLGAKRTDFTEMIFNFIMKTSFNDKKFFKFCSKFWFT